VDLKNEKSTPVWIWFDGRLELVCCPIGLCFLNQCQSKTDNANHMYTNTVWNKSNAVWNSIFDVYIACFDQVQADIEPKPRRRGFCLVSAWIWFGGRVDLVQWQRGFGPVAAWIWFDGRLELVQAWLEIRPGLVGLIPGLAGISPTRLGWKCNRL
jgi:hypothetical protein